MPININNYIASGNPALYAGPILFRQGRADTPLLSMIGNRRRTTNSEIFIVGQHFASPVAGDSVVSETQSATEIPDFAPIGRKQTTNVTQIHTKSIAWTDYGTGNRGLLNGPNLANQQGNPNSEVDFQRAHKALELAQDIEYAIINSKYQFRDGNNNIANRTRGLLDSIKTNVMDLRGNEMSWQVLNEMLIAMADNGAPSTDLILGCNDITATQLAIEAKAEHFEIVTGLSAVNGIAVTEIHTVRGVVRLVNLRYLPDGTALLLNIGALSIVEQPFQNGNWNWMRIGRQAASEVEMLAGAWGLDCGYEGLHGVFTGIATSYSPYTGTKVFIANQSVETTEVGATLDKVVLGAAQVGVATADLGLTYNTEPAEEPILAYQWKIGSSTSGLFYDIEGATDATYTPTEDQVGKYLKVEVVSTGGAVGQVLSNARKIAAADGE